MIADKVTNLSQYFNQPWVEQVLQFYNTISVDTPNGIYHLDGENLFCKVLDYHTKKENWITESHRKYIDIQISLQGQELIEIYDNTNGELEIIKPYKESTDCTFYKYPVIKPTCTQLLTVGFMGIYFPHDIHTTQIAVKSEMDFIKKAVFKVSQELIHNK
jgi:YhcH/YjgK/YiaL family protein